MLLLRTETDRRTSGLLGGGACAQALQHLCSHISVRSIPGIFWDRTFVARSGEVPDLDSKRVVMELVSLQVRTALGNHQDRRHRARPHLFRRHFNLRHLPLR